MAIDAFPPDYNQYVSLDKRSKAFVGSIPFEDLPLFINDSRYLVSHFVKERLKGHKEEST